MKRIYLPSAAIGVLLICVGNLEAADETCYVFQETYGTGTSTCGAKTDGTITWRSADSIKRGWGEFDLSHLSKYPNEFTEVWLVYTQTSSAGDIASLYWAQQAHPRTQSASVLFDSLAPQKCIMHLANEQGEVRKHEVLLPGWTEWPANPGTVLVIAWDETDTEGEDPDQGTATGWQSANQPILIFKP